MPDPSIDHRRVETFEKRSFQASHMTDRYREIARRLSIGQKNVDIARDMNVTKEMVSYVKNSPRVQEHVDALQLASDEEVVNVTSRIKELCPAAVEVLKFGINDEETPLGMRIKASLAILDRAGHGPVSRVHSESFHAYLDGADIMRIKGVTLPGVSMDVVDVKEECV